MVAGDVFEGRTRCLGSSERFHDDGVVVGSHSNACTLLRHLPTTPQSTDRPLEASQKGLYARSTIENRARI